MDRVFLDANVLFSAAYRQSSALRQFWSQPQLRLVTSLYAVEEARRNLVVHQPSSLVYLDELAEQMEIVEELADVPFAEELRLAEKDRPILAAAVGADCTHLLTGDKRHFGGLYGTSVNGVLILTPAEYARRVSER